MQTVHRGSRVVIAVEAADDDRGFAGEVSQLGRRDQQPKSRGDLHRRVFHHGLMHEPGDAGFNDVGRRGGPACLMPPVAQAGQGELLLRTRQAPVLVGQCPGHPGDAQRGESFADLGVADGPIVDRSLGEFVESVFASELTAPTQSPPIAASRSNALSLALSSDAQAARTPGFSGRSPSTYAATAWCPNRISPIGNAGLNGTRPVLR